MFELKSQWIWVAALVCAVVCPHMTVAQDLHAVERRLAEGVVAGELSLKQAAAMMETLRDVARHGERRHEKGDIGAEFGEWIESVAHDLKRAVDEGKLSEEDAWKKWAHFKEHELHPKLRHTVEEGHMSEEHAREIMYAIGRREAEERLKAAVDRGDMSEREARQKLEEIERRHHHDRRRHEEHRERGEREHAERKHHDERMAKYRALEARIRRAVESGDLSR
ncbi:MAG: hypothetical protein QF886_23425, partial [Planctomycetota bacterium]|nr:hypothetical protein [Planctomycetota bacterium]